MKSIMILGIGTQIGLNIIRSLGSKGIKVFGISNSKADVGRYSKYLTKYFSIPFSLKNQEEKYVEHLIALLKNYAIDYLITINENSMLALNRHRDELEKYSKLLIPPKEVLARVLDKAYTMMIAKKLEIPIPNTIVFNKLEDLDDCQELTFPVIVKPASRDNHNGEQKKLDFRVEFFQSFQELSQFLKTKFSKFRDQDFNLLIQEYCGGEEIGFPIIMRNNICISCFQYKVLMNCPPNGGAPVYRESVKVDPELKKYSVKLLKAMNFDGVAEIDYIRDHKDNKLKLLEVNGRFWGTLPLTIKSGSDFPYLFYQSLDNPITIGDNSYKTGVKCRLLGGYTNSLMSILVTKQSHIEVGKRFSKFQSLMEYIKSFHPSVKDDIQSLDDPIPGIIDFLLVVSKPFRRILELIK